jgi:glycosyltransferase involved in cell wall biosynthesis
VSLIEAQAAGVPVVSTRVGGAASVVAPEQLVPPGDADALADALTRLLRDRDDADKLATAAREAVEHQDWRAVARRTAAVYAEVVAEAMAGVGATATVPRLPARVPPRDVNLLR